ncbi:MAG: ABC transporter permease subunit [Patescibacteria group bacterium]
MNSIWVIAKNTFKEAIRDRILYGILGFAVFYLLTDLFFARLALGDVSMVKSFGLAGIYVCGVVVTVFLGASVLYKEIESRTLYFVISKPVTRAEIVLGKFFGLFAAIALTISAMAAIYLGVVGYEAREFDMLGLLAILFELFEMGFFVALLLFFSSFASPLTATIYSSILLFSGHLLELVLENAAQIGGITLRLVSGAYYILPNLEKFNIRGLAAHHTMISWPVGISVFVYAVAYSTLLLYFAIICFKRREL